MLPLTAFFFSLGFHIAHPVTQFRISNICKPTFFFTIILPELPNIDPQVVAVQVIAVGDGDNTAQWSTMVCFAPLGCIGEQQSMNGVILRTKGWYKGFKQIRMLLLQSCIFLTEFSPEFGFTSWRSPICRHDTGCDFDSPCTDESEVTTGRLCGAIDYLKPVAFW